LFDHAPTALVAARCDAHNAGLIDAEAGARAFRRGAADFWRSRRIFARDAAVFERKRSA
jgi:hypothetical protein